jgi:predicted XRE-type DNA-binding protein
MRFRRSRSPVLQLPVGTWNSLRPGSRRQNGIIEKGRIEMATKGTKQGASEIEVTSSSGNVFQDLGFANPEQELLKARLLLQIQQTIKRRGLSQVQAAAALGIKQPHVSNLMRGYTGRFSVERLMEFLTCLGHDIDITVHPSHAGLGEVSVNVD